MILKMYHDTVIDINEEEKVITLTRGRWNFTSVRITLEDENINLLQIFKNTQTTRVIDINQLSNRYKENLLQLVTGNLFFISETPSKKALFITDSKDLLSETLSRLSCVHQESIMVDKSDFKRNYIAGKNIKNPVELNEIQVTIGEYLQREEIKLLVVVLAKVDDVFCKLINKILHDNDIEQIYLIMDNRFSYIFGVKYLYTGCYSCFSQRNTAKMKKLPQTSEIIESETYSVEGHALNNLNFILSYLVHSLNEYYETGAMSLCGRIICIFNQTLEVTYENLLRSSLCNDCGYVGRMRNVERNIRLKELVGKDDIL